MSEATKALNETDVHARHSREFDAYRVEWRQKVSRDVKTPWKVINQDLSQTNGSAFPPFDEGALILTHTLSYAQAKAIMWEFKASTEADHPNEKVDVRMLRYRVEVNYIIKEHENHEVETVEHKLGGDYE